MIKHLKYILLITLVFISCKNNNTDKPKKPDNLIPKDSMVDILYDISLINSAKGTNKKLMETKGIVPEDYVYKRHNIDSLQFVLSNEYYSFNLETYEDIYNAVKVKLEKDKKHFQAIVDTEKKVRDSLNKIRRKEKDSLKTGKQLKLNNKLEKKPNLLSPLKKIDTSEILIRQ